MPIVTFNFGACGGGGRGTKRYHTYYGRVPYHNTTKLFLLLLLFVEQWLVVGMMRCDDINNIASLVNMKLQELGKNIRKLLILMYQKLEKII